MDGAYKAFIKVHGADVVEDFARKHREDCEIRLAKIANGADPSFRNGNPKPSETRWVTGAQWDARRKGIKEKTCKPG